MNNERHPENLDNNSLNVHATNKTIFSVSRSKAGGVALVPVNQSNI